MFDLSPDSAYPVVIIMAIILIFEWVGGLSSVALTDCIQAVVMVFTFVTVPCVLTSSYYGWKDLDPDTYPRIEFYQTPSKEAQWEFWQFSLVNFSFFTLPHLMQRTYAATDLRWAFFGSFLFFECLNQDLNTECNLWMVFRSLKVGYGAMTVAKLVFLSVC